MRYRKTSGLADCATDEQKVNIRPSEEGEVVKLLRLVDYKCRETISILKVLLGLALEGRLRGVVVLYRMDDGRENTVFTGVYKRQPREGAGASMRMSLALMQANGETD
jgi:hypothetical protein